MPLGQCQFLAAVTNRCFFHQSQSGRETYTPIHAPLIAASQFSPTPANTAILSPVTSTEDVVPRFTPASIRKNATCHKIAAKKMHDTADANGNQRYRQPLEARRKISFRRIPSKNVMKIM